jgi:hypothetical protein
MLGICTVFDVTPKQKSLVGLGCVNFGVSQ